MLPMMSQFISAQATTPQPPEGDGAAPLAAPDTLNTEEAVDLALAQLDAERARYQAIIDTFAAEEQALLDRDAPQQDFSRLDMRVRDAGRKLRGLDMRERKLVARGAALSREARSRLWAAHLANCRRIALDMGETLRTLSTEYERARHALSAAWGSLGGNGIAPFPELPRVYLGPLQSWCSHMQSPNLDQVLVVDDKISQLVTVRFHKWTAHGSSAYQAGQTAGFKPGDAHWLVDLGAADFVGRKPPKPPGYKPPHAWQREAANV